MLDQADYIRDLGFGAVWVTPIVDSPDASFNGGERVPGHSDFSARGKTGLQGY